MLTTKSNITNESGFSIERLATKSAFPHEVEDLQILETHISWVILTGKFAYKVKKPIQFDFVDYSTREKRKEFCYREFELNRRFAPDMYIGVVPVFDTSTGIRVGTEIDKGTGEDECIEHAVKMKQFSQDSILAAMLASPLLTGAKVEELGRDIAKFHQEIESAAPNLPIAQPERMFGDAKDNFEILVSVFADDGRSAKVKPLKTWTNDQFQQLQFLMSGRLRNGKVRLCHGDLHLKNIVDIENRLVPFDGIEFNAGLQWNDVISEIAFPVMDFVARGRSDLGWRLLNAYLENCGEYEGLPLLRYYLVYRAMVRAKVTILNPKNQSDSVREKYSSAEETDSPTGPWDKYLRAATEVAFAMKPFLWITHGVSGSGKSTKALSAIEARGGIRIRSDVERHRLAFAFKVTDKYSSEMNDWVYTHLLELATTTIKSGLPVVVDATFLQQRRRDVFRKLASDHGVPFGILHCEAPSAELERRIRTRESDPSEATVTVLENQLNTQEPLSQDELPFVVAISNKLHGSELISRAKHTS